MPAAFIHTLVGCRVDFFVGRGNPTYKGERFAALRGGRVAKHGAFALSATTFSDYGHINAKVRDAGNLARVAHDMKSLGLN